LGIERWLVSETEASRNAHCILHLGIERWLVSETEASRNALYILHFTQFFVTLRKKKDESKIAIFNTVFDVFL
jgi:hypothetical protein